MSQSNTYLPTVGPLPGLTAVNDINSAFQALQSLNSGSSAPANNLGGAATGQLWGDASVGGKLRAKMYDGASWLTWGVLDTVNHIWQPQIGGGVAGLASAATTDLGSVDSSHVTITGSTTITSFGSSAPAGILKTVGFTGSLTLTHNATSLILPTQANITTAGGDTAIVLSLGSGNWFVLCYQRISGAALKASLSTIPFSSGSFNGTLVASVAANALTIAVKTRAGVDPSAGDPVLFTFRNATAATGDDTVITLTSALSITVPSGATLGTVNGQANRIWVGVFNNGGTPVLGVYNSLNGTNVACWNEAIPQSGVNITSGSTSPQTWYTGATITTKALRILGYVEAQQSTAGTWAASPTAIELFGPGIKRPGDVVQEVNSVIASTDSTASATFVALTNNRISITPQSAANLIRVEAGGYMNLGTPGFATTFTGNIRLSRGTTNNSGLFGQQATALTANFGSSGNTSASQSTASIVGYDVPNTTSATTYAVQGSQSAGTLTYGGNSLMAAREIQI